MPGHRNRTASAVRHAFDKNGANMGQTRRVSWSLDTQGVTVANNAHRDHADDTMLADALAARTSVMAQDC